MGAVVDSVDLGRRLSRASDQIAAQLRIDPFVPHDRLQLRATRDTFLAAFDTDDTTIMRVWLGAKGLTPVEDPRIPDGVMRVIDPRTGLHDDVSIA